MALETGKMYMRLFHGRSHPKQPLKDWGRDGPIFGPLSWAHISCGMFRIAMEEGEQDGLEVHFFQGMVYYDGYFYADVSVFIEGSIATCDSWEPEEPDPAKMCVPEFYLRGKED